MKKSILALFVLLFILILTCVYQKTYQIYAENNDNTTTTVSTTSPSKPTAILPSPKKEDTVLKVETHKVIAVKPIPEEPKITVEKKVPTTAPVTKVVKAVSAPTVHSVKKPEEVKKKELALSKPIAQTKPAPEKESKPVSKKEPVKTMVQDSTKTTPSTTVKENHDLEEIDSLMQALKDRNIALENRAKFELQIQQLITKALDDRFKAIAHMNREEIHLLYLQKELLKARDIAYEKIGQTNTPTSGE